MKFALINGERREAEPSRMGECPSCGNPVVAKCGEVRIKHWAHKARARCDAWWETETEWHRAWKNQFPSEWQEVIHYAENGEKHIADVKTDQGWVIEFQHSHIKPDERGSREDFYGKLIWVVDGNRRVLMGSGGLTSYFSTKASNPLASVGCPFEWNPMSSWRAMERTNAPCSLL